MPGALTMAPATVLNFRTFGPDDATEVLVHVHGFAISGSYLVPTAEALSDRFRSVVPDLPGFGRTPKVPGALTFESMADHLARLLDTLGLDKVTLVGNSMGCPVVCEFDHRHHGRLARAILVSPAGGLHSKPFLRAAHQLARDALLEPPSLARVAAPDYLRFGVPDTVRLFAAMTRYPTVERFLNLSVPALAVIGSRDPLIPGPERVYEVMNGHSASIDAAVIIGAAHAINWSHPVELSALVRRWIDDPSTWHVGLPSAVRPIRP
jgi:pimeloyl-ACP methyl ester carboxylesterase